MTSEWRTIRAADFIDFNPRLSLVGDIANEGCNGQIKAVHEKDSRDGKSRV